MPDSTSLQIDYHLTRKDLVTFWRDRWADPKVRRTIWTIYAIVICWMVGSAIWNWRGSGQPVSELLANLAVSCGIVLTACALTRWWLPPWASLAQSLRRDVVTHHQVTATPTQVSVRTSSGEKHRTWAEIVGIIRSTNSFLLVGTNGFACIIPQRAFPSPEAAEAFYQSAYNWHAGSKAKT